jgi:hypothetical protein
MFVYGVSWCVPLEEYAFSISSPSKTEVKAEGVFIMKAKASIIFL